MSQENESKTPVEKVSQTQESRPEINHILISKELESKLKEKVEKILMGPIEKSSIEKFFRPVIQDYLLLRHSYLFAVEGTNIGACETSIVGRQGEGWSNDQENEYENEYIEEEVVFQLGTPEEQDSGDALNIGFVYGHQRHGGGPSIRSIQLFNLDDFSEKRGLKVVW